MKKRNIWKYSFSIHLAYLRNFMDNLNDTFLISPFLARFNGKFLKFDGYCLVEESNHTSTKLSIKYHLSMNCVQYNLLIDINRLQNALKVFRGNYLNKWQINITHTMCVQNGHNHLISKYTYISSKNFEICNTFWYASESDGFSIFLDTTFHISIQLLQ